MNYVIPIVSFLTFMIPLSRWLMSESQRASFDTTFVVFLAFSYFLNQWYLKLQMTIPKESVNDAQVLINPFLESYRDELIKVINREFDDNLKSDDIRANIMLIIKRRHPFMRRFIKIFYHSGQYGEKELNMHWYKGRKGSGTCGEAWNKACTVIFDSKDQKYRIPQDRLDKKQKDEPMITDINSVLSVQIKKRGSDLIIGVLNFDSKLNIDRTRFNEISIITEGLTIARKLIYCLPTEQVKL